MSNQSNNCKTCRKCGNLIAVNATKCPVCGFNFAPRIFFSFLLTVVICIVSARMIHSEVQKLLYFQPDVSKYSQGVDIRVKPMVELSGLSVKEILEIRKNAVKETIALGDVSKYEPSERVFSIEDGLPWIGAYQVSCVGTDGNDKIGEGESRESLGVLNPEILYYFIIPTYGGPSEDCTAADYLVPRRLMYHKAEKTLIAYVDYTSLLIKRGYMGKLHIADANAHDFGYNFAHASYSENISFRLGDNFSREITQTRGFWHRGYACGLKEGCNNYSPQNDLTVFSLMGLPATINIKLWKDKPLGSWQEADINYRIILE